MLSREDNWRQLDKTRIKIFTITNLSSGSRVKVLRAQSPGTLLWSLRTLISFAVDRNFFAFMVYSGGRRNFRLGCIMLLCRRNGEGEVGNQERFR